MSGESLAALAMLGSAILHAGMTFFTKQARDRLVFRSVSIGLSTLIFLPVAVLNPIPPAEVWPFLLFGAFLVWVFNMLMISAFDRGEMNLVYPVMRGAAPALAAIVAFLALRETLPPLGVLGLAIATAALVAFAWPEKGGVPKAKALGFALACAAVTAGYSVNDAAGVRLLGDPVTYAAWFFVLSSITLTTTALVRRGKAYLASARAMFRLGAMSALFNAGTYTLALYAYANAPVAQMAAIRETSFVFGAILSALVLKESFGLKRFLLAIGLAGGLVLLQLA
ncbi:EamA family transporter [Hyphobacterium marinum]|uniref:EamA family transporter n=1 Tax=Hyphobacterium marinum TaxID=3116574 RepID=A0ABU7LVF7_9PROT|nr:EamA family transporter [Hyphobacterium sp. Y6023]MEE2565537.1 EamA family transporter [Hyphobacterium sp. Y6023]